MEKSKGESAGLGTALNCRTFLRGSAAVQYGKALPYRSIDNFEFEAVPLFLRLRRDLNGFW